MRPIVNLRRATWFDPRTGRVIEAARQRGFHVMLAGIDAQNEASVRLHATFGFQRVAHLKEVGFKFGRWLDVVYLELVL